MSQPEAPSELPFASPSSDGSLLVSISELALLAHIGERLELVLPALPPQEADMWRGVLGDAVQRGVLQRSGEDFVVRDVLVPYLVPIIEADFAIDATVRGESTTFIAADEKVVTCERAEAPNVRIRPVPYEQLEGQLASFLGFDGEPRGEDGPAQPVPADEFRAAVEQLNAGGPVEIPSAPAFAAALTAGDVQQAEVRWINEDAQLEGVRYEWVDAADGLWVTGADADAMTVTPSSSSTLWSRIEGLLP